MSVALNELKDYVGWESGGQARAESTVLLHVTHSNLQARMFEIRLDRHMRRSCGHTPVPAWRVGGGSRTGAAL